MAEGGGLSAGTVSLPVKPDTAGFAGILGKSVLSAVDGVSKAASERFTKLVGTTTKVKAFDQGKVALSAAADMERASMKVRVAEEAQVASAAKLRIAQLKAAEAQDMFAAGSSKLVAAQERLAAAERLHASTTSKVESAAAALVPVQARVGVEQAKLTAIHERGRTALGRFGDGFKGVGGAIAGMAGPIAIAGGVAAALGVEAVKAAANFQTATTRLVTDAGESEKNLKAVQAGILKISTTTGTSADEIAKGMYLVESSGYHGAAGIKVMAAAAEGAKIGGADLTTVSDALTTVMKDYGLKAGQAATTTSKLIATVSTGKTTMEQLAGSLHSVLPAAEAAHISLGQVLGAVGTMTSEGISAEQATQNLNHAILSLQNPTAVQTKAMAAMGLSSLDVSKNLGPRGLTGTLDVLQQSILKHMGPSGLVLQNAFNQSKQAAQSANDMLKHLPPSLQTLGKAYLANQISQKDWTKALKEQPALTAAQGRQFATVAKNAHGFSDALKSGSGPASTFVSQLAKMTGGQVGLQVALHLSGIHAGDFAKNVHSINGATAAAGGHVKDWATIQATFNQKMSEAKASLQNAGIVIGTALMPAIEKLLPYIPKIAQGFAEATPTIKSLADSTVAVFKVMGPVISQIVKFTNGLGSMNGATNKTSLVMAGLHGKFGPVLQVLAQFGFNLGKTIGQVINWGKSVGASFAHGAKQIGDFFKGVGGWFSGLGKSFAHGATQIGDFFKSIGKRFADGWAQITGFFSGVIKNFAHGWAQITGFFKTAIEGVKKILFTGFLIAFGLIVIAWNKIVQIFGPTWNKIVKIVSGGIHAVQTVISGALKVVAGIWNAVWGAISSFVSGIWKKITSSITSGTGKSSSVISGALKWISNLWNSVWGAISSFVAGIWKTIAAAISRDVAYIQSTISTALAWISSKWNAEWSQIFAFLAPIWNRITSAVATGVSTVVSFIGGIAGKVLGAVSDFGSVLYDAGRNLIQGLINGVTGMVGSLVSTVQNIAGNAISAAKNALGIHSPSTVFHTIGTNVAQGLVNGLLGSKAQVVSASNTLANVVIGMFQQKKGGISAATKSSALDFLHHDTARLVTLANRRTAVLARITAEKALVSAAQSTRTTDISNVTSATTGLFSVTNYTSGASMVAGLKQIIAGTKQFTGLLARLVKAGIDPVTYRQIVEAGVGGGGIVAATLLLQQPSTIKQVASLEGTLAKQSNALGTTTANHLYSAGVSSAQGLLKGLQSQSSALTKQMEKLATSMVNTLKKKLGIHSPSTVFAEHGLNITAGLSNGIKAGTRDVHDAIRKMTDKPVAMSSTLRMSQGPNGAGAPVVYMPDTITVTDAHGFEVSMKVVAEKTYKAQGQYATARAAGGSR